MTEMTQSAFKKIPFLKGRSFGVRFRDARFFPISTSLLLLLLLTPACSPVQGYPGPERSPTEIALVTLGSCAINQQVLTATLDGQPFSSNGITVLPGPHTLHITFEQGTRAQDCQSRQDVNYYGYDACRDEREKEIKKGKSGRDCNLSTFTSTVYDCLRRYQSFTCSLSTTLNAGSTQELCAEMSYENVGTITLYNRGGGSSGPVKATCTKTGDEIRREELASPS